MTAALNVKHIIYYLSLQRILALNQLNRLDGKIRKNSLIYKLCALKTENELYHNIATHMFVANYFLSAHF